MSADEVRRLVGGYATGSLTEAERKVLFDAALEDQDLFEELAGEQALKEVLDEPGARQRLVAALEPPRHRARLWWVTAPATLAIVMGVLVWQRTQPPAESPREIAQARVAKSPEPPVVPPSPVRKAAPAPAPPEVREKLADQVEEARGMVAADAPAALAMRAEKADLSAVSGFSLNYAIRGDGFLLIVPAARGFLSITANGTAIFPSGAVSAGTPVRIPIPPEATSLVIAFSRTQGITGTPVRRDEPSGTVTDQDPPNQRITIQLFLTPATR